MGNSVGRPTDYCEEIVKQAHDYINGGWITEKHAIPSVVGLCKVLKRSRSVIYRWAEDEEKEFKDILDWINQDQHFETLNKSLKSEINPMIGKLVLGKHGYHEKVDSTTKTTISLTDLSEAELDHKLQQLESLHEQSTKD